MPVGARAAAALKTLRILGTRVADGSDASWHPAALTSRVVECFEAVQLAWTRRDAEGLRPYVSEIMYERTAGLFEALESRLQVNRIEDLRLGRAVPIRIDFAGRPEEDRLFAYVDFRARDWLEDLRTGDVVDGDRERLVRFRQEWSFVRRPELGWVVDQVDPDPELDPDLGPDAAPAQSVTADGNGQPVAATAGETRPGDLAQRLGPVALTVLCALALGGGELIGHAVGKGSAPTHRQALRARAQAERKAAASAQTKAYREGRNGGYAAGLARGRSEGAARGTRQGARAGRAEGERRAAVAAAAAAAASRQTSTSGTSGTGTSRGTTGTGTTGTGTTRSGTG